MRLIVEVSKKRSLQYIYIIDMIKDALHKKHLTNEEALDMRDDLRCQFSEKGVLTCQPPMSLKKDVVFKVD